MTAESAAWVSWLQPSKLPSVPGEEPLTEVDEWREVRLVTDQYSSQNAEISPSPGEDQDQHGVSVVFDCSPVPDRRRRFAAVLHSEAPVLPTERVRKHATVSRLRSTMNAYLAEPTPERTMKITVFNLRAMIPQ